MPHCRVCQKECTRGNFSKAQLKKSPDQRKCKNCVTVLLDESSTEEHHHQQPQNKSTLLSTESEVAVAPISKPTEEGRDRQQQALMSKTGCGEGTLRAEISKLQSQLLEIEVSHEKKIQELESKVSEAFQGMERAKQKIAHLEILAGEAVVNLKTVQEQASAELESLRTQLEQAQSRTNDTIC